MYANRITGLVLSAALLLPTSAWAQRVPNLNRPANPQANAPADAPTVTGKVVAYDPEKLIAVEITARNGPLRSEFTINKEKTRIELPPRMKEIAVGAVLSIWADKENPALAARIGVAGGGTPPAGNVRRPGRGGNPNFVPGVAGQIVAYEAEKSVTIETRQRGGQAERTEFAIVKDQTKIEFLGDAKALAVGLSATVTPDKNNSKLAARIIAGAAPARPQRGGNRPSPNPANPAPLPTPKPAAVRPPRPPVAGLDALAIAAQIDEQISRRLAAEKLPASPVCDDGEFIRRVYLDLTGVIPPADRVADFLASRQSDKRQQLIDELLASPQFGRHLADLWCERINVKDLPIDREPFLDWLAASLNTGRGWDEIVHELMTAGGSFNFITRGKRLATTEPQALFLLLNTEEGQGKGPNPAWLTGESGRLFLGVQLQCAECHDHPFTEAWKQTDFWGLAAFFGELRAEQSQQGRFWRDGHPGDSTHIAIPPTALKNVGQSVPAKLLGSEAGFQRRGPQPLRQTLAQWMTSADNPFFARATANRLWSQCFGRGLVNPVDDLRPDNPASHPEILELLAGELRKSQFDVKHLLRCLCQTAAYQRTSQPLADNEGDQVFYSHMAIKTLGPGVFYDSLQAATGWPELKLGLPERKTKLTVLTSFTPREVFVDFFRSAQGAEADPLDNDHGIPQALKLMNAARLSRVSPLVERLAAAGRSREQVIDQLYLTALARRPTPAEAALVTDFLDARRDVQPEPGYAALLWTLINSAEFVSNH